MHSSQTTLFDPVHVASRRIRFNALFGWLLLIITILGCGGSGGGAPKISGLLYVTNWANRLSPGQITGVSQRISVLDQSGLTVSTILLQNPERGIESNNFALPDGNYVVLAELYSLTGASGVKTGEFRYPITISSGGGVEVRTNVGNSIANIAVAPNLSTIQVGRGAAFFAYGVDSAGQGTFVEPSQFEWSVLGGIGSVTTDGALLASAVGSGSVRATYLPTSRSNSAAVTVTAASTTRSKWTVLVYMNAANDLQSFSLLNMNQMERVASNPQVRFVVQWKQYPAAFSGGTFNGTRRYLVKPDTTSSITSEVLQDMGTSIDMGSTTTLREFISWGKANYPADRYCLIVWNHGNGWRRSRVDQGRAVSYDDERGTSIQIWDLNQALGSERFDILAWDASLMQMFEVAYEVKDNATYIVGSEESPPGEGYPYDTIFGPLRDNPDQSTRQFTKNFVDGMLGVPAYASRKITQSVLESGQLEAYATALSNLGVVLKANQTALSSQIQNVRSNAKGFSVTSNRIFLDAIDVVSRLEALTTNTAVLNAIAGVKTAHNNAVVWEGNNANSEGANGVSIDFSSGTTINPFLADYKRMKFAMATQWDEFLETSP